MGACLQTRAQQGNLKPSKVKESRVIYINVKQRRVKSKVRIEEEGAIGVSLSPSEG